MRNKTSKPQKPSTRKDKRAGGVFISDHAHTYVEGDIAGRDIIKSITNKFEVRWRVIVLGVSAPLLLIALLMVLPQLYGDGPMTADFNIAVAEFGAIDDRGNVSSSQEARDLSDTIFNRIDGEIRSNPTLTQRVQVRHAKVGLVRGSTEKDRTDAASVIAKNHNAHLVIYGYLEKQDTQQVFSPLFYAREFKGAEELLGANRFGAPVSLAGGAGARLNLSDAMQFRSQALAYFAMGLAYLVAETPDKAVTAFEQAGKINGWQDEDGKEVLYLWMGTAYTSQKNSAALGDARGAYAKALELNPDYARAYIGIGNTYYLEFSSSDSKVHTKLEQAQAFYEKARGAKDKSQTALVEAKIHTSLGNVYIIKAQQPGGEQWYPKAETEYLQVVNQFERGHEELKPLIAPVYLSLGIIQDRWRQNYVRASEFYKRGLAAIEQNETLQKDLESNLASIHAKLGTPSGK